MALDSVWLFFVFKTKIVLVSLALYSNLSQFTADTENMPGPVTDWYTEVVLIGEFKTITVSFYS